MPWSSSRLATQSISSMLLRLLTVSKATSRCSVAIVPATSPGTVVGAVGFIGIGGYLAMLGAWVWGRSGNATARLLLLGMAAVGVVASIYLTWLELFVIEAVCMWCLSSAVIMGLMLLAAAAWLAAAWPPPKPKLRRRAAG